MKLPRIAATMPFAHLLGRQAASVAAKGADEELDDDTEKKDARRAEDGDKDPDDKEDNGAGAEESEDDSEKEKKSKKAKAKAKAKADDDGDEEEEAEEDDGDDKEKAARTGERARCKAIFACAAAGARPDMAAHFAFNTNMSARSATAMLEAIAAGSPNASGLSQRMAAVSAPNPGANAGKSTTSASGNAAAMILQAGKARRGES